MKNTKRILACLLLTALLLCGCGQAAEEALNPQQEALCAVLDGMRDSVTVATAGSSLRAAAAAASLLDWAEQTDLEPELAAQTAADWFVRQTEEARALWPDQADAVAYMVTLLAQGGEEAEGLLRDAGCESAGYPWSERAAALAGQILQQ